jgi:hypothetical protein
VKWGIRVHDKFWVKLQLKWVEKVRNYGNWSKILGVLEEGFFFGKIIIRRIKFKNLNKIMRLYRKEMILILKSE